MTEKETFCWVGQNNPLPQNFIHELIIMDQCFTVGELCFPLVLPHAQFMHCAVTNQSERDILTNQEDNNTGAFFHP